MRARSVFVTGGSGALGRALIPALAARGHRVRALARERSRGRVPAQAEVLVGDALDARVLAALLRPEDVLVQLVGVAHPSPAKAAQFESVDLASLRASVAAASAVGLARFVYVSVARPAPVMRAYQAARAEGERVLAASGLEAVVLQPWYVLGPGRRWPLVLAPLYALAERVPATRASARRLGLVSLAQMTAALVRAVELEREAFAGARLLRWDVPRIRAAGADARS